MCRKVLVQATVAYSYESDLKGHLLLRRQCSVPHVSRGLLPCKEPQDKPLPTTCFFALPKARTFHK